MIFRQFYLECLSHASYLVGDETTGEAVVVDPQRDVGTYLDEADRAGLHITRVIETHVHADFVSGHLELAQATGARIAYGEAVGETAFAVERLAHHQRISLGEVALEILATPGHTPESICVVIFEHGDDPEPWGVLTGDTLFIGDVGRPDLLASGPGGMDADTLARRLYHSLHDVLGPLPDPTRVFPAHGAGSSCGKQLSTETSSTLGAQRRGNYALRPMSEDAFVDAVTEGQSAAPAYFAFDAARNREQRALLDEAPPPRLDLAEALRRQAAGAQLLDTREPADFAAAHLSGTYNVGLQGRLAEYAGAVLDPSADVVLVGDPSHAREARLRLGRIGFDRVVGVLAGGAEAGAGPGEGAPAVSASRITIEQLAEHLRDTPGLQVVDVRGPGETAQGTIPTARTIPLASLRARLDELDPTAPAVVYCASGYRSMIAASVLSAAGFTDVSDLVGGIGAWGRAGLPTPRPPAEPAEPTDRSEPPGPAGRSAAPGPTTGSLVEVDAAGAAALTRSGGALLVDVREPEEWSAGHAPHAYPLPMRDLELRAAELPANRPIVAVCRSGGRSGLVTEALRARGLDARNLAGGMQAWAAAGLPVVLDDGSPGTVA